MKMQCEKCKTIVIVKNGKDLLCGKCGHKTKNAYFNDVYGVDKPLGPQCYDQESRFFNPK